MIPIKEYSDTEICSYLSDMQFESMDDRSMFMNYLCKHGGVAAIDIDGVLCNEVGDYGERIKLRDIPETGCKYIVLYTSRLECDRDITVKWLEENGIKYDALVMNKLPYSILIDDKSKNI